MSVKKVRTVCTGCHVKCGAIVHSEDNHIIKIEGDPNSPVSHGMFCGTGFSEKYIHDDPHRVIYPMHRVGERGSGEWKQITWDEALTEMTEVVNRVKEEYGAKSIVVTQGTSRTTDDWGKRLKATIGHIGWGMAPLHVCLTPNVLPHMMTMGVPQNHGGDLNNANTIVFWGASPNRSINNLRDMYKHMDEDGAKLIVIDPRFNDLAATADLALMLRPGTDGALALGIMHILIEENLLDKEYIDSWTYGFNELAEICKEWTPERTAEVTWLDKEDILTAAHWMGGNKPTTIIQQVGASCMHTNAIQTGRAISCLECMLGPVDVPGGFVFGGPGPQGAAALTLEPKGWNYLAPEAELISADKYPAWAVIGMAHNPYDTFDAVITGKPWPVKVFVFIADDPFGAYEDPAHAYEALTCGNLDLIVVKDFYMTEAAKLADIVLPTADWSERDVIDDGSWGGLVVTSQRAVDPPGECWSDWRFMLEWGKRLNPELWPWETEKDMLLWRLDLLHEDFKMTWDEYIEKDYLQTEITRNRGKHKKYETGDLRPDKQLGFPTKSGRIEFYSTTMQYLGYEPLPVFHDPFEGPVSSPEKLEEFPYVLTTGFRLYSFFHSAWTNVPDQRQLYPDPFFVMHPDDARKEGIEDGDWCQISTGNGTIKARCHVSYESAKGVVNVPRPGWRDACEELNLPGFAWDVARPNVLVPGGDGTCDPGFGAAPMRSLLCNVKKEVVS